MEAGARLYLAAAYSGVPAREYAALFEPHLGVHFGEGLQQVASDFGVLGGRPSNPKLLDNLANA